MVVVTGVRPVGNYDMDSLKVTVGGKTIDHVTSVSIEYKELIVPANSGSIWPAEVIDASPIISIKMTDGFTRWINR